VERHKNIAVVFGVVFLLEVGEKMTERFLPIYLMAIGASTFIIGLSNALDNLVGALYSLPGGYLSDRFGYKHSLLFFNFVALLGYLIIILFPSWIAVLIGAILFTSWGSISLPAILSAVSKSLPASKQTMGVSLHSLIRRFPMAIGPVLGGVFIAHWGEKDGVRAAFIVASVIAVITIFIQWRWIKEEPQAKFKLGLREALGKVFSMSSGLRRLLASDILIRYCEQIPYAFVVIWCIKVVGISAPQFGILTAIEMITAILVYIPVAYLVQKTGTKKPYIAITFGFFSLFPLVLLYSHSFWTLVFAFFIRGLKEFGEPTRKSLILDFAHGPHQGTLYGAYYMIRDVIVALAALIGGLLWAISPALNLWAAFGFGLIGLAYFLVFCSE
ncbi:MAG: MFS transporter, partial [Bdellovibrionota bacterium]